MYNGACYPNGSYFKDTDITELHTLKCALPYSTLSGGEWSESKTGPGGGSIDCNKNSNSDPLRCSNTTTPASLSLYKPTGQSFSKSKDQLYKCCLPTSCSNPDSSVITAHIFSNKLIISLYIFSFDISRICTNSRV